MKTASAKPVLLSAVQPTGNLTIGNYIGALKNWTRLQETHDCLFMLADLHAVTVRQEPAKLRQRSLEFASLYLACGIDPLKSTVFFQSHVPGHAQLAWLLNCFSRMGELRRMTQFKEKVRRQPDNVNAGLFDYPVLMAADILLYGTAAVPVGDDQQQHLEFTRSLAQRFNRSCGEIFNMPQPYIPGHGARIRGLLNPEAKMSKSDRNSGNYIALLDPPDTVRRKIRQAVTDPGRTIRRSPDKPGISNLLTVFSILSAESPETIEARYMGRGYAEFKEDLAAVVIETLSPIQQRYRSISADRQELLKLLRKGAAEARSRARITLAKVHDALGLIPE